MRALIALMAALAVAGCATLPPDDVSTRRTVPDATGLPSVKAFARAQPSAPGVSNANIAADFLDLHFALESGRELPRFTRFEDGITVRVTGAPPPLLDRDLDMLIDRLRREAGIEIRKVPANAQAAISIEAVSRARIRRILPDAACFVVPNVESLDQFRRDRRKPSTNWANLETRTQMTIVLPNDASPQEVRDCLHEELAQSIGPLNDLYRLPDSVFNDDNVHAVLTGFDMLILKTGYAPELQSGMTREQVAERLPAILARLNPRGARQPVQRVSATPRDWIDAVQTALGPGTSAARRQEAAAEALRIAAREGWQDHRRAFSHYIAGRMTQNEAPTQAEEHFRAALRYVNGIPSADLHAAYITTQTARFALAAGDPDRALRDIRPALAAAREGENAALLTMLMILQSEALARTGRTAEARSVRLDSLGWARYGFGTDWTVQATAAQVAALQAHTQDRGMP